MTKNTFPEYYTAPPGTIWICGACGKHGREIHRIGDESCFVNAVLVYDDKPASVSTFDHPWNAVEFPTEGIFRQEDFEKK